MRKSLFSKIFTTQVIVALTVVIIIVPMIFVLIGEYFVSVQKDDILDDATRVASLTLQISDLDIDEKTRKFYNSGIEFAGGQSTILVVNSEGKVVAAPNNLNGVDLSLMDKDFIKDTRNGKSVVNLYDKGKMFTEQTIVAIVPIIKTNHMTAKETFLGATVALRPVPVIRDVQYKTIKIILMAQAIAWLVAFLVSFILTRHIVKPLKQMRKAARSLAMGNFSERIAVKSNDEIGELAHSFNSMTRSLSEIEDMRTSFLSDVSHELRTPMTIINGFVDGILDGTIPPEQQEKYLTIVSDETKRLSRLVKDLLEATRIEQNVKKLNKVNFDMNRLVTESAISYEQQFTEKHIEVNLLLDEKECFAYADKDSIKRVLINLIDNAIKFTPNGGKIVISTSLSEKKVKIGVENTGRGIPKEDLDHIWERFYKSDKSRSVDKKGVGLGLHIIKTIISQHNGTVEAESEEGSFARFTFTLDSGENSKNTNE